MYLNTVSIIALVATVRSCKVILFVSATDSRQFSKGKTHTKGFVVAFNYTK